MCEENVKENLIEEKNLDTQVLEAYKLAKDALDQGDVLFAARKFNDAEILFPIWMGTKISANGCIFV